MVRVKICGLTCLEDALAAARLGADALGFVLAPSPRQVTPGQVAAIVGQLPPLVQTVGVFVNAPLARIREVQAMCGLDIAQLHGEESEEMAAQLGGRVIKALQVADGTPPPVEAFPGATLLLEAGSARGRGGTGQTFDWRLAVRPARQRPIILAGGLDPDNVAQAIETVGPYAVDVSSGVESEPGRKDHDKLARFIHRAKTQADPA